MDNLATVHVALEQRSYDIEIGAGLLSALGARLQRFGKVTHAIVVSDDQVARLYGTRLTAALRSAIERVDLLFFAAGETSKSVEEAHRLWEQMLECGADRQTLVVALGGGVVGDLAGFLAATYARGLRLVQVPTTLLAHVDSSVGGKVGVNLSQAKNMVGAFWQPVYVLIDTQTLETLPLREYRAGLAEVAKYGVILDADLFGYLEEQRDAVNRRDADVLRSVIARCCQLKAQVVQEDERELTGTRAVLNYGHTFAHAFEALTGYGQLLHGEAVAIGMLCASRLAELLGMVDGDFTARQGRLLEHWGLPTQTPSVDEQRIVEVMRRDKKAAHGKLRFVLPTRMGHVQLVDDVEPALVRAALHGPS